MDTRSSPLPPRDRPPFDQADSATGAGSAALRHSFTQLEALADRCEQATAEQQRDLLESAFRAVFPSPRSTEHSREECEAADLRAFAFWRKLDAEAYESATLTLVPEGCLAMLKELWDGTNKAGHATVTAYSEGYWQGDWAGTAATLALAITAAALRAEAAKLRGQA